MEMLIKFSDKFNKNNEIKKATREEIEHLESEFKIRLPNDYKFFIINIGNIWTPDISDIIVDNELEINDVQDFWDIESIRYDKINEWTSQLLTDLIPFALDSMGNLFCFLTADLKIEKETKPVYLFDHDFDTVDKVSESFCEWINEFNKL